MHSHLVAIKIRVERSAHQRMEQQRFARHNHWLKRLNS